MSGESITRAESARHAPGRRSDRCVHVPLGRTMAFLRDREKLRTLAVIDRADELALAPRYNLHAIVASARRADVRPRHSSPNFSPE